jgi:hypothetical protein
MKIYWSAFFSLTLLLFMASCGSEQFGTTPQSTSSTPNPVSIYDQASCTSRTLIKPQIDFLYVVDNSTSNNYISSSIKSEIQNTLSSISDKFDYRVIGTPLLETAGGNDDFQVFAKDPSFNHPKEVASVSQFTFFSNQVPGSNEPGLRRIIEFLGAHQTDGLFRQNAYLFIIVVSNGFDTEIETIVNANGQTGFTTNGSSIFTQRKNSLLQFKNYFSSQQLRLFSIVPHSACQAGWRAATRSYVQMSQDLYYQPPFPSDQSGRTGQGMPADSYNLCGGTVSQVFASVNSAIDQITIPHSYKYWPITSTNGTIDTQPGKIKVYKKQPNGSQMELTSGWSYYQNPNFPGPIETRVDASTGVTIAGEPSSARHLIEFSSGSYPTYPDCISVTTLSNLEYFGYVVLPKIPKPESVVLKIRGQTIQRSLNGTDPGWFLESSWQTKNIKVAHDGYPDTPVVIQSGYMLKLIGGSNYYKSGDSVEIDYIPAQQ